MKLLRKFIGCLGMALLLLFPEVNAQTSYLVNTSYDPVSDSIFIAKVQKKLAKIRKQRPTVALVLAGGGAKGAAHIGVLKYIEEKGIPVDFIAGTSMGGLMGGLYAMGYSANEIDTLIRSIDWNVMMSDQIPLECYSNERQNYKETYVIDIPFYGKDFLKSLPSGYLYGHNIYNMMSSISVNYQHNLDFTTLPTPYCCVATEIVTQTEKHWTSGSLIDALRSTMSIPGYFRPVRVDSMILSDGGTKNNFPTDMAKAVGADIIIGIELTMPRDYEKVNNAIDVLMQTAQYSSALETHNKNVKNADIYITPDITGFGMLSFGTKEIETLIQRGYNEAAKHEAELDSIIQIVGSGGRTLHYPKARNITNDKIKLNVIEYEGISDKEMRAISHKIDLVIGNSYNKHDFEQAQAIIFGTGAFSQVIYRVINDGDGYRLVFRCDKRPTNSFGIGLRADSEEWMAALINAGFGKNKIYGSKVDITARLCISPYLMVDYNYLPIRGPKIGTSLKMQYRTLYGSDPNVFRHNYYEQTWINEFKVYLADNHWNFVNLSAGLRINHFPYYRLLSENESYREENWTRFYPFVYFRFVYNNEDNKYFPNHGLHAHISYDYNLGKHHYLAGGFQAVIPTCKIFTIVASINGRYILGQDPTYINMYMDNYVGGIMAARFYEQQLPFIGFNGERGCLNMLTTADINLRFKIFKNGYLSAIGAALHEAEPTDVRNGRFIGAAGIQFGYKSKFGPIFANVHWNSLNNRVGFYIGAGYDF